VWYATPQGGCRCSRTDARVPDWQDLGGAEARAGPAPNHAGETRLPGPLDAALRCGTPPRKADATGKWHRRLACVFSSPSGETPLLLSLARLHRPAPSPLVSGTGHGPFGRAGWRLAKVEAASHRFDPTLWPARRRSCSRRSVCTGPRLLLTDESVESARAPLCEQVGHRQVEIGFLFQDKTPGQVAPHPLRPLLLPATFLPVARRRFPASPKEESPFRRTDRSPQAAMGET